MIAVKFVARYPGDRFGFYIAAPQPVAGKLCFTLSDVSGNPVAVRAISLYLDGISGVSVIVEGSPTVQRFSWVAECNGVECKGSPAAM
jgi:hypothetical protein